MVGRVLNEKTIGEGKSWMGVELRERKWSGVLGIEKVGVECCWMVLTIVNSLIIQSISKLFHVMSNTFFRVKCYSYSF